MVVAVILSFFISATSFLFADEREIIKRASQLAREKEYIKALQLVEEGMAASGKTEGLTNIQYRILLAAGRHEEALRVLDTIIAKTGDDPEVMIDKIRLLMDLERLDEALKIALEVEKNAEDKSPYMSFMIFQIYLSLNDKDKAYDWLERSVERGLNEYDYLLGDDFETLQGDTRFEVIISKIKDRIGIGKPAKDFTAPLLSQESYSLSQDRGKVVLLDFWATWCPPCVAEIPKIKDLYETLHGDGFEIIGISMDTERHVLESFVKEEDVPWKIAFSGKSMEDETARLYGITSIPKYFLIDTKGILRFALDSGAEKLERAVKELLKEQE